MEHHEPTGRGLPVQRRRAMAAFLAERPDAGADLHTLSQRFEVSEQTVRRDLTVLEHEGLVERTFGGAIVRRATDRREPSFHARERREHHAKAAMAAAALAEIQPEQGLFLDGSSSVLYLARLLPGDWCGDAATAGMPALVELASRPGVRLTVLGGGYHRSSNCLRGSTLVEQLARLRFDTAVISARAVHPRLGLCEADADEAALKRTLLGVSARVIVLADPTKLGRTAAHHYGHLDDVDLLLTGPEADDRSIVALQTASDTPVRRAQRSAWSP